MLNLEMGRARPSFPCQLHEPWNREQSTDVQSTLQVLGARVCTCSFVRSHEQSALVSRRAVHGGPSYQRVGLAPYYGGSSTFPGPILTLSGGGQQGRSAASRSCLDAASSSSSAAAAASQVGVHADRLSGC